MISTNDALEYLSIFNIDVRSYGESKNADNCCSFFDVQPNSLSWYNGNDMLGFCDVVPNILLVGKHYSHIDTVAKRVSVLAVDNPRLIFAMLANKFFHKQIKFAKGLNDRNLYRHHGNICIGHNTSIAGDVDIGDGTVIGPNCVIMPGVQIGCDVTIGPGSIVGSQGFGYVELNDTWMEFPQLGAVKIGNHSRIGSNCTIDRGALSPTIIGENVVISNACQIAHNVKIDDYVLLASRVVIGGSVLVEKKASIWQGAVISKGVTIGSNAEVMLGSVVVQDVPSNSRVSGNFAVPHHKNMFAYSKLRKK